MSSSVALDGEEKDVFYVYLPNHPGKGKKLTVKNSIRMRNLFLEKDMDDILNSFGDVDIVLDFDVNNRLIGIEIIT